MHRMCTGYAHGLRGIVQDNIGRVMAVAVGADRVLFPFGRMASVGRGRRFGLVIVLQDQRCGVIIGFRFARSEIDGAADKQQQSKGYAAEPQGSARDGE